MAPHTHRHVDAVHGVRRVALPLELARPAEGPVLGDGVEQDEAPALAGLVRDAAVARDLEPEPRLGLVVVLVGVLFVGVDDDVRTGGLQPQRGRVVAKVRPHRAGLRRRFRVLRGLALAVRVQAPLLGHVPADPVLRSSLFTPRVGVVHGCWNARRAREERRRGEIGPPDRRAPLRQQDGLRGARGATEARPWLRDGRRGAGGGYSPPTKARGAAWNSSEARHQTASLSELQTARSRSRNQFFTLTRTTATFFYYGRRPRTKLGCFARTSIYRRHVRGVARERVPDVWWKSIHLCIGQTARVYDRAAKRRHEFKFVERSSVAYGFGRRSGIFAPNPRGGNSSRVSTAADRLTPSA